MSMNGINGYSYSYNPYAYNNAYSTNATSFQGNVPTEQNSTANEQKDSSLGVITAIGVGIGAIATAIYAFKKGKSINGADSSIWNNLKTGFIEIGQAITKKVNGLVGKKSSTQTLAKDTQETIVTTSQIAAQDADLVAKYGSNMSVAGYFHSLC